MPQFLATLLSLAVPVFAVSSMLAVGMKYPARDILEPLSHRRGVFLAIAANFLLIPLLAYGIDELVNLDRAYEIGLILVASAAGAPFLIKLTQTARGDLPHAAGLLLLLVLVTIVYMPFAVTLFVPEASVNSWAIARTLFLTMLLPLGVGQLTRWKAARISQLASRWLPAISTVSLATLVALLPIIHFKEIVGILGEGVILTAALLFIGSFAIGYQFSSPRTQSDVNGLAASQRNIAAAMVVAQDFPDPGVLVTVVVSSLVGLAIMFPIARRLRKRRQRNELELLTQRRAA